MVKIICPWCARDFSIEEESHITGQCGLFCPKCGSMMPDPEELAYIKAAGDDDHWFNGPGWYFWDKTETENMKFKRGIGPYPDLATAKMAMHKLNMAVGALSGISPDGRGLYIHLTPKESNND